MTKRLIITKENLLKFFGTQPIKYFNNAFRLNDTASSRTYEDKQLTRYEHYNLTDTLQTYRDEEKYKLGKNYHFLLLDKNLITEIEVEGVVDYVKLILDKFMPNRYHIIGNNIYLYYPEFTITNDIGETNIIRDLVVEIITSEDKVAEIRGNRYTFSREELNLRYRHSHLPTRSEDEFSSFCLGGGSDVKNFVDKLGHSCTPDQFELLLAQLDNYLVWESRAGRPHISISGFYTVNNVNTESLLSTEMVDELAVKFINNINPNWLSVLPNDFWFFDPGLNEVEVHNLELKLVDEQYHEYCFNFDPTTNKYVQDNTRREDNSQELPSLTGLSRILIQKFNITPRITENPERFATTTTIKRLSPQDLERIFNKVNSLLASNMYIHGTTEVTTQS